MEGFTIVFSGKHSTSLSLSLSLAYGQRSLTAPRLIIPSPGSGVILHWIELHCLLPVPHGNNMRAVQHLSLVERLSLSPAAFDNVKLRKTYSETSLKDHPYSKTIHLKDHICVARIADCGLVHFRVTQPLIQRPPLPPLKKHLSTENPIPGLWSHQCHEEHIDMCMPMYNY
jgi:hypothetical protein